MLVAFTMSACNPPASPCDTANLTATQSELTPDKLFEHCGNPECGNTACEDEDVVVVGFPEFVNTTDPDQLGLQPAGVIFLSNSDVSDYECSRSTVQVTISPETNSDETAQAVEDLFRAIHATRDSPDQTHSNHTLHITGKIKGQDLPLNGSCARGLSVLVNDPAQVVID
jgi:hypothetical protein